MLDFLKNPIVRVYVLSVVILLSISVSTNMYLQTYVPNDNSLNNSIINSSFRGDNDIRFGFALASNLNYVSENSLAVLFMPQFMVYRTGRYVYNNFDKIVIYIQTKVRTFIKYVVIDILYEKILVSIFNFAKYVFTDIIIPTLEFLNERLKIIVDYIIDKILHLVEYILREIIVPCLKIFHKYALFVIDFLEEYIRAIINFIIDNIQYLVKYIWNNIIVPFCRIIRDAIIKSIYQIFEILEWLWDLFLRYLVYPLIDLYWYIYSLSSGVVYKIYCAMCDIFNSIMEIVYSVYNNIIVILIDIWNSMIVTLCNVYDNIVISLTNAWTKLVNSLF